MAGYNVQQPFSDQVLKGRDWPIVLKNSFVNRGPNFICIPG